MGYFVKIVIRNSAFDKYGIQAWRIRVKLKGIMIFRNNQVYLWDGSHEINLFSWLASFGLKDKEIEIEFRRGNENGMLFIKQM